MTDRETIISNYLNEHGFGTAKVTTLPRDASFRSYRRIHAGANDVILMNAPPEHEDIKPFIEVGKYLSSYGFSAPTIYNADTDNGLMILEDLGTDSVTKILNGESILSSSLNEHDIYICACEVLIGLMNIPNLDSLPLYDEAIYMREVRLLTEWFLPAIAKHTGLDKKDIQNAQNEYKHIWSKLIGQINSAHRTVVLRDYHADNLMWLANRESITRVGLLDFQDALLGSPLYDLVSLLEDARRDVTEQTVAQCKEHFASHLACFNHDTFETQYALLAAQRNCKIVGIFTRLCIRDNKPHYLDYLPRVWGHLNNDIAHPILNELADWFKCYIPKEHQHLTLQHLDRASI